jgi:predicted lipid-binding transport protein (Tim44 family)
MDEFFDIPTLIAIGIAVFVLWRLRQVLGTRTGNERPAVPRVQPAPVKKPAANDDAAPAALPAPALPIVDADAQRRALKLETEIDQLSHGDGHVASGLKALADADPAFSPKAFFEGAKSAYEMIVTAFATGDRKTLKSLLDKDVYDGFETAIAAREAEGKTVDFTFVGLPKVEITAAELDKRDAHVTVAFTAQIVQATKDKAGAVLEGSTSDTQIIADEWTFARNPRARDPNWKLIATNQLS